MNQIRNILTTSSARVMQSLIAAKHAQRLKQKHFNSRYLFTSKPQFGRKEDGDHTNPSNQEDELEDVDAIFANSEDQDLDESQQYSNNSTANVSSSSTTSVGTSWSNEIDDEFERELREQNEEITHSTSNSNSNSNEFDESDDFTQHDDPSDYSSNDNHNHHQRIPTLNEKAIQILKQLHLQNRRTTQPESLPSSETSSSDPIQESINEFIATIQEKTQHQQEEDTSEEQSNTANNQLTSACFNCLKNYANYSIAQAISLEYTTCNFLVNLVFTQLDQRCSNSNSNNDNNALSFSTQSLLDCMVTFANTNIFSQQQTKEFIDKIIENSHSLSTEVLILLIRRHIQSSSPLTEASTISLKQHILRTLEERLPKITTMHEFLLISELFSMRELKDLEGSNTSTSSTFMKNYFLHSSKLWSSEMNAKETIASLTLLHLLSKRDFSEYSEQFDAGVLSNLEQFSLHEITLLLRFYDKVSSGSSSSSNTSPVAHELVTRRCELLIQTAKSYLEKANIGRSIDSHVIPNEIVEKLYEIARIKNQLQFFQTSSKVHKKTINKITSNIYSDNPQYLTYINDVASSTNNIIENFEEFSTLLCTLHVNLKPILIALSEQFQKADIENMTTTSLLEIYRNFNRLNLSFPFTDQLIEKLSNSLEQIDFSDHQKWQLIFHFICTSSLNSSTQSEQLLNKIEPILMTSISARKIRFHSDSILELLTYLPTGNSFSQFISHFLSLQELKFSKKKFYSNISLLITQKKLEYSQIEGNQHLLKVYMASKSLFEKQLVPRTNSRQSQLMKIIPAESDLIQSLKSAATRFTRDELHILPLPHFLNGSLVKIIIVSQRSGKVVHADLLAPSDVCVNDNAVLAHRVQLKKRTMSENNIIYDYVTFQSFFSQDREILATQFLEKHFAETTTTTN